MIFFCAIIYSMDVVTEEAEKFYEKINIRGKVYEFIMTSSTEVLKEELDKLCCRLPYYYDYRLNPALSPLVRKKMTENKAKWSITTSNGVAVLNYYKCDENEKGTPYVIRLSELIDSAKIHVNFQVNLIKAFIQVGHKIFPGIASEWSALMIAISQRKTEIVKFLLESGVDANSSDSNGFTPLMLASFLNETEIINLLIRHNADVNAHSKNGFSALIYAIYVNSVESVKLLQQNGANLNISLTPQVIEEKRSFLETFEFYLGNYTLGGIADLSRIYKNFGMSKQTFSKIRSSQKDYHPKKSTVLQLAIGLRLTLSQTESLLGSAGYIFEKNNPTDQIFREHIEHLDFDIHKINEENWRKTGKSFLKE